MANPIRHISGVGESALTSTTTTTHSTTTSSTFSTTSSTAEGATTYSTTTSSTSSFSTTTSTSTTTTTTSSSSTTTTTAPPPTGIVVTENFSSGIGNLTVVKGDANFTLSLDSNRSGDEPYSIPGNQGQYAVMFSPDDNSNRICFASLDTVPLGHNDVDICIRVYSNYFWSEENHSYYLLARYGEQYAGMLNGYGIRCDGWNGYIQVGKFVNGVWTSFIEDQAIGYDWMYYRVQVSGSSIKYKWWEDDEMEPYDWCYETTDTDVPTALSYPVVIGTASTHYYEEEYGYETWFDYISVGTGGEEPVVPNGARQYLFGATSRSMYSSEYINHTLMIGGKVTGANRNFRGIAIYWHSVVVDNSVRAAVYQGGTVDDPSGATLLYDFGLLTPTDNYHLDTFSMSIGAQVAITSDVLWLAIKSDNNDSKIAGYPWSTISDDANHVLWKTGNWTRDKGYFTITSEVTNDETVAFPATVPSGTYSASGMYYRAGILLDGNPYSPSTTTTTTTITTTSSSTASTTSTSSSTASTTSSFSTTSTSSSTSSTASSTSSFSTTSTSSSTSSTASTTSSTASTTSSFSTTSSSTTTTEPWVGKRLSVIVIGV